MSPSGETADSRRSSVRKTTSIIFELVSQFCRAEQVAIWANCLMPNHVHLIVVPQSVESLRRAIGEAHFAEARDSGQKQYRKQMTSNLGRVALHSQAELRACKIWPME